ncbi:prepilin peptidase [Polynucleobacter sp. AP-Elch-400A-B2]|nr:prepilin peptidase [Polynucleobacter sp. AP-Elch-400A-B2]
MLQANPILMAVLGCLLGACLGSFVYACAQRIVAGEDPFFARSRCRSCDKTLLKQQLIPIYSWLSQKGRCACSKLMLNKAYLYSELGFALLLAMVWYSLPLGDALALSFFYSLLGICFFTDYLDQVLHMPTMLILIGSGILIKSVSTLPALTDAILGGALGYALIYGSNLVYRFFRKKDGFGGGDAWLLAGIGAWTNPIMVLFIFVMASWIGAIFGITSILRKKSGLGSAIPFGTYLVISTVLVGQRQLLA